MNGHLTKGTNSSQSQMLPAAAANVASDVTQADRYVVLCDWHGRVVWKSGTGDRVQIGDELWKSVVGKSKEGLKSAVASVVTLRENRTIEVENERGEHFRLWMWPLLDPEIAICILAMAVPSEMSLLTDREKDCLQCLAQGRSTKEISEELSIGLTTVHTHLRRSREKLNLPTGEALVSFAARYYYVPSPIGRGESAARKRSG